MAIQKTSTGATDAATTPEQTRWSLLAPRRRPHGLPSSTSQSRSHLLNPDHLPAHVDRLYRAAWALCGSKQDAEDLVQETFVNVLRRPRFLRDGNEIGYLLRALKNTHANRHRAAARRPRTRQLFEHDAPPSSEAGVTAREIMHAIASAPPSYRDAVIAVDLLGLSYGEAARSLRTREATIATRVHRGRRHVARELRGDDSAGGAVAEPVAMAATLGGRGNDPDG